MYKSLLSLVLICAVDLNVLSKTNDTSLYQDSDSEQQSENTCDTIHYGIHGNALAWLTLAPHAEFDVYAKQHWQYSLGGSYGWWGFNGDQHALQTWKVCGEVRRYFVPFTFTGHSMGLRAETGQIDARLSKYGRRGKLSVIGLTYAYTWRMGKTSNWYFDAGLGVGAVYYDYVKYVPYKPTQCYHKIHQREGWTLGLTNVGLNFAYRFPYNHNDR
jgi:hypothetical protein